MNRRNSVTVAAGVKLGIFTVVSVLVTGLLAVIMGNIGLGAGREYTAIFTNASMLQKGDDVRIAGVNVGEVKEVDHYQRTMAEVRFRVEADVELTTASLAEIRFLNLIGDRYLALERGQTAQLHVEDVIGLGLVQIEGLHEALPSRRRVVGGSDDGDDPVDVDQEQRSLCFMHSCSHFVESSLVQVRFRA